MAKKKREHIVFDQMLRTKKSIPFGKVNKQEKKTKGNNSTFPPVKLANTLDNSSKII